MIAATSWPDALIAIAGIVVVAAIIGIVLWQIFGTGRTAISSSAMREYRKLAEDATAAQARTADALEQLAAELKELSTGTRELERMLKEVG